MEMLLLKFSTSAACICVSVSVLIIQKLNESYIFLNEEHALVLNFQNAENRILGLFLGKHIISRLLTHYLGPE